MSLKDTWAKWEKEEKERKPETEYYQWVDQNGYVHDKEREIWHLSVYDFVKKYSIVYYSKDALRKIHKDIEQFATSEQLTAHANSIRVRFEEEDAEKEEGK